MALEDMFALGRLCKIKANSATKLSDDSDCEALNACLLLSPKDVSVLRMF